MNQTNDQMGIPNHSDQRQTALEPEDLRKLREKSMSMVFQNFALLPHKTVLENAAPALKLQGVDQPTREAAARKWLGHVGFAGPKRQYPHQLSDGMQQRVGIARALMANSEILLMDEAFSALDPLLQSDMQELLLELQRELQKIIAFITHDLDEALKIADHLIILKVGAVVQQGNPQHILMHPTDSCIEEFAGNINRARVLWAGTIANPSKSGATVVGSVDTSDTLETIIAPAAGRAVAAISATDGGVVVGSVDMYDLLAALLPYKSERPAPTGQS